MARGRPQVNEYADYQLNIRLNRAKVGPFGDEGDVIDALAMLEKSLKPHCDRLHTRVTPRIILTYLVTKAYELRPEIFKADDAEIGPLREDVLIGKMREMLRQELSQFQLAPAQTEDVPLMEPLPSSKGRGKKKPSIAEGVDPSLARWVDQFNRDM